ncbi:MAG: helix-turn-helix domain-containing protein [Acidimicrobiales bacterium]
MDGVTLQRQARALGDPTRHAIFRAVADAATPIDVATLTERFGFNHNAIRQHLAKLVDAGLVVEATLPPNGPGRPRLVYHVDPEADGRWGVTGPFERLALLLSEVIRTGETPLEIGRRAGHRTAPDHATDPVEGLTGAMAEQGFRPELERDGDRFAITLHHCPFASTAVADPGTVCALHRGIADGIAEAFDGLRVDGLEVVADPTRGGCRITGRSSEPTDPGDGARPAPGDGTGRN